MIFTTYNAITNKKKNSTFKWNLKNLFITSANKKVDRHFKILCNSNK